MKKNLLLFLILLATLPVMAQVDPVDKNGVAIGGYDLVAYFNSGKAVKGSKQITVRYNEATYYFSSPENSMSFEADPQKYLPQYEGYCALAVSYGKKISIDPETFKVVDDKLYLFYRGNASGKKVNSLETWNKNEPRLLKKANELWPDVKKRKYKEGESL